MPKKQRKKYRTPEHPWRQEILEEERVLLKKYGLKNKKEVWKAKSLLKKFTHQVKRLIRGIGEKQTELEKKQLIDKLYKLNLIEEGTKIEDVLNLTVENILDRRLQSFVYKLGLTSSINQARQFIIHGHIYINGRKIDVPSYLISREEEGLITFNQKSSLANPEHPERLIKRKGFKNIEEGNIGEIKEKVLKTREKLR